MTAHSFGDRPDVVIGKSTALGWMQASIELVGAACVSADIDGHQVIGTAPPLPGSSYTGAVLAPWPNRVAHGTWRWGGRTFQLPVNEPERDAALHGLVAQRRWDAAVSEAGDRVRLTRQIRDEPGYPFAIDVVAEYRIDEGGLIANVAAVNAGEKPAPVGLGVHPYFTASPRVDDCVLQLDAADLATIDRMGQPTVKPVPDSFNLSNGRSLRGHVLDHGYGRLQRDGLGNVAARLTTRERSVEMWAGPTARWLMVFTADTLPEPWRRRAVAIEPMTCLPNALATGDIDVVPPGGSLSLSWGIRAGR